MKSRRFYADHYGRLAPVSRRGHSAFSLPSFVTERQLLMAVDPEDAGRPVIAMIVAHSIRGQRRRLKPGVRFFLIGLVFLIVGPIVILFIVFGIPFVIGAF